MAAYYDEGLHVGEVIGQALTKTKNNFPQVVLKVKILGVPADDTYTPHSRQLERTVYLFLTEKAAEFTVEALKKIGFDKSSFRFLDPSTPGFHDFTGQQVDLWCKHEEYQGKMNEKWSISIQSTIVTESLAPAEMRQLDALFGKALKSHTKPAAKTPVKGRPLVAAEDDAGITDDDIPF